MLSVCMLLRMYFSGYANIQLKQQCPRTCVVDDEKVAKGHFLTCVVYDEQVADGCGSGQVTVRREPVVVLAQRADDIRGLSSTNFNLG